MPIDLDTEEGMLEFNLKSPDGKVETVRVDAFHANALLSDLNAKYQGQDGAEDAYQYEWLEILQSHFKFPDVSRRVALNVADAVVKEAARLTKKPVADSGSTESKSSSASGSAT